MTTHNRKLKFITLDIDGTNFQCQVQTWTIENNTEDGEKFYSFFGGDTPGVFDESEGEFREEAEDDYALALNLYSDWRSAGVSDFLWDHDQETVTFQLDHHPDVPGEHVRFAGSLKIKSPSVGGEPRTTEMSEVTLPIIGKPTKTRVGA